MVGKPELEKICWIVNLQHLLLPKMFQCVEMNQSGSRTARLEQSRPRAPQFPRLRLHNFKAVGGSRDPAAKTVGTELAKD